ncbi:MAG: YicC/YloC family endoribonuclease [Mizugakiibacter sp.]|uniref:YicC/YloC family endoribonuclease n=1 Tax=Mizugakiibacter sp. TaxID=1972610 RepID=UPI0031BCCC2D|nr:YicC family protein [Xanthomonadaceae bacterium]
MIRSMTAFAGAEANTPQGWIACELRAVNHRYLEINPRLPDELRPLESQLREQVTARLARGKVDMTLRYRAPQGAAELRLDDAVAARMAALAHDLRGRFPDMHTDFATLLAWPGLLVKPELDQEGLGAAAQAVLQRALDEFVATREREGDKLRAAIAERLDAVARIVAEVRGWLPEIRAGLRARLEQRLAELKQPLEPGRLEQEVVLQVQRIDVDEELDRLAAHVAEARRVLGLAEAVGRRLDFLMQEFNREANTLGSKSADPRTTRASVELKVLIEQIREQVQNIE